MAEKKISFGFKQVKKQPILLPNNRQNDRNDDIEMIQCLEGKTIKVINEKIIGDKPIVIPLKNNQRTSAALALLQNLRNTLHDIEETVAESNGQNNEINSSAATTLEDRVVNELLAEARNDGTNTVADATNALSLPMNSDKLELDGAKESTAVDYEDIPISQFGMAMLRGMGLKDEEIKTKKSKEPELRPKGMGLGADKLTKPKKLLIAPALNETLEIKKNAYVRILAGKYKDLYGQIEALDDHAGRLFIKLALGGVRESLNEFMVQPVSKQEYAQYGKVINSVKYEEYKKKQDEMEDLKSKKIENSVRSDAIASSSKASNSRESSIDRQRKSEQRNRSTERRKPSENRDRRGNPNESHAINKSRRSKSVERRDQRKVSRNERSPLNHRNNYSRNRTTDNCHSRDQNYHSRDRSPSNRKKEERSRSQKQERNHSISSYTSASLDSDSSSDSSARKRSSQKKHSKKKHKSSKSKFQQSDDDDRHVKKKTKKSKRQRSRSRGRK